MPRIKELDYLRGLAAMSILLYHYVKWLYIYDGADSILGRLSVYAVEIFYVLSGITLYVVYNQTLSLEKKDVVPYYIKRIFRIIPLFWLSIAITLVMGLKKFSIPDLLLNMSGLFSVFDWDNTIAPGSWSIGNEMVFYLCFPLMLALYKIKPFLFGLLGFILVLLFNYFAYFIFNPADTLHNRWTDFVNPLNHLLFFYIGMCIPIAGTRGWHTNSNAYIIITIGLFMLFVFPSGKDGIDLLTGFNRWFFTLATVLICIGFYQMDTSLPDFISKPLKHLGEISYGIYLLHPLVYYLWCFIIRKLMQAGIAVPQSNSMLIALAGFTTIVVSHWVYRYYEMYFIKKAGTLRFNFYKS